MKKKPKKGSKTAKRTTKIEKCESFFNFFNPPEVLHPDDVKIKMKNVSEVSFNCIGKLCSKDANISHSSLQAEKLQNQMEEDYEIA